MSDEPTHSTSEEPTEPRRSLFRAFLHGLGEPVTFAYAQTAGIFQTLMLTLHYTFRGRKRWGEIVNQMYQIGNRSLIFISAVLGFLGMILIFQSATQTMRITGDLQYLGAVFLQLLIREFVPTIGALMLATRVGTGIAAEIGSMVVTEQVDALRMTGAEPIQYLIVPRFIACTVMSVVLMSIGVLVAFGAGMLTAQGYFDVNPRTFINISMVKWDDVIVGLAKTVSYGMAIPIVSGQAGLAAFGGSEGVGWATTQAVVNASLAVVILNFVISGISYVVFPGV
jgi:phospholipid/cholesterol/gamma-HCH transport system permease protein